MANIVTPEFRVSFPYVFKPQENKQDDGTIKKEYSVMALFPKGADLTALKNMAAQVMIDKFGPDKAQWPDNWRNPFRDQGEKKRKDKATGKVLIGEDGKPILQDGCEAGAIFMNFKSKNRPGLVQPFLDPDTGQLADITDETQFYAGCYARASVNAYWYEIKGNKGISFGLGNLQKTRDGDPLGGRTRATDDFQPIETPAGSSDGGDASSLFD